MTRINRLAIAWVGMTALFSPIGAACGGADETTVTAAASGGVWRIEPQESEVVPLGRLALLEGTFGDEAARFALEGLDADQPVEVIAVSGDPGDDLRVEAMREWDQPLASASSDDGVARLTFRIGGKVHLRVSGEAGTDYQLATWVGPVVEPRLGAAFAPGASTGGGCGSGFLLGLLVAGGGAAIFFFWQRRSTAARAGAIVLALLLPLATATGAGAEPGAPPRTPDEAWDRTQAALHELRERLNGFDETGWKPADDMVGGVATGISILEQVGFIDPREAAVQADYDPSGAPPLPTRCTEGNDCSACFAAARTDFDKWRKLLEDQWVIYRQTELEAGRIIELADAAAGLDPRAKLLWTVVKNDPSQAHVKAQATFYAEYDKNYHELLRRVNENLIAVGKCEEEHFGDDAWYPRFGQAYYLFLRDRYERR